MVSVRFVKCKKKRVLHKLGGNSRSLLPKSTITNISLSKHLELMNNHHFCKVLLLLQKQWVEIFSKGAFLFSYTWGFSTFFQGQLNSEWIHEIIVSPKKPTKNCQDFCPRCLLEGRAEILVIFGWHFGRNDDLIN